MFAWELAVTRSHTIHRPVTIRKGVMLPSFLIIGAPRCGTSWLHRCLKDHPQISVASEKEVDFFELHWDRGIEWYENLFEHCVGASAVGEATPGYMYQPLAIERMATVIPDVKLIAILRNPINRAYSQYWLQRNRYYEGLTFEEAMDHHPKLIELGLYATQVQKVLQHFSPEQLLILFFEDLQRDNQGCVRRVFEYLEVDSDFVSPSMDQTYNAVLYPRLQDTLAALRLSWIVEFIKKTNLGTLVRRRHSASAKSRYPQMQEQTRQALRQYYAQSNSMLGEMLGITFDWD